ncbi:sulfurtransferase [Bacterioplanes sanyensis]|uniref:sulfurtransferase n=1 Tax=Bacterioplanes sanyensis TaxID=1249553 RepID=UPI00198E92B2|nr:sulfurtransferase [Bacterioplanes sanyensis]GGY55831.1 sulfurtransferase [Bacterioplanes sanyensis]
MSFPSPLVDCQWLAEHLSQPNLVLLDASMQTVIGREPIVYEQPAYIPGAQVLDLEQEFCDQTSSQVHAFPTADIFADAARRLGINRDSRVVIYDNQGIYSAPRAWWIFKTMGVAQVAVLDGGLPQWLALGHEVVAELASPPITGNVCAQYNASHIINSQQLLAQLQQPGACIIDVRSAERFAGKAPEPRPGVRSGHIPGSINIPFANVLDGNRYKTATQLRALFARQLPDMPKPLVFSCGSGITACIVLLAAVIAGFDQPVLYDGSWAEWGSDPELPIETE